MSAVSTALAVAPAVAQANILTSVLRFFGFSSPGAAKEESSVLISESRAAADAVAVGAPGRLALADDPIAPAHLVHNDNAYVAPLNPGGATTIAEGLNGGQIFIYKVRSGDTLSTIARSFDVSVNTILWANSIANPRALRVGEELLILPVTGVRHEVKRGDTIASIAKKYGASSDDIIDFNGLENGQTLVVGTIIIVPDGEIHEVAAPTVARQTFSSLPMHEGYYLRPIIGGRRSNGIHGYNGVDLANSCGLPVFASASGTVIVARSSGWNGGYGKYVVISHPNSTQTLYAHLSGLTVAAGQVVSRGEIIGSVGSTGKSTGCHVHFEVRGARNPF